MKGMFLIPLFVVPSTALCYTVAVVGSNISYNGGTWPSSSPSLSNPRSFANAISAGWQSSSDFTDIYYGATINSTLGFPDEFISSSPLELYLDRDEITITYTIELVPDSDEEIDPTSVVLNGVVQTGYAGSIHGTINGSQDLSGQCDWGKRTNQLIPGTYTFDQWFRQVGQSTNDRYPTPVGTYIPYRDVAVNFPAFSLIGGRWLSTGTVTYDIDTIEFDLRLANIMDYLGGDYKVYGSVELTGEWRHRIYQVGSVWSQATW